jgi:hypothetical protein
MAPRRLGGAAARADAAFRRAHAKPHHFGTAFHHDHILGPAETTLHGLAAGGL